MATIEQITADAARIGLRADADNDTSRLSAVAPAVWFWGTIAQCRRLAGVLGVDIVRTENSVTRHADLFVNNRWCGFISAPCDGAPEHGIRLSQR